MRLIRSIWSFGSIDEEEFSIEMRTEVVMIPKNVEKSTSIFDVFFFMNPFELFDI